MYFTVCSGLLAGIVAIVELPDRHARRLGACRVAAAVGVVLSAVIFAVVIAPATPTGTWFQPWDDAWVRTATVLFHGVAPVLVITNLILRQSGLPLWGWLVAAYSWPLLYLAVIGAAAGTRGVRIPYPFLSPSLMGWSSVAIALGS
nr:hypothetical protein [Streptomyces sp. DSM 41633]